MRDGHRNSQSVVGQGHAIGQRGVHRLVINVVAHVREERAARLQCRDLGQGLIEGEVGGMGFAAKRVNDEHVQALEQRPTLVGYPAAVGQIAEPGDAVTHDVPRAVPDRHGYDALAEEIERTFHLIQFQHGPAHPRRMGRIGLEDVRERAPEDCRGGRRRVAGNHLALDVVVSADVVKPEDVIGMRVGEKDRIQAGHLVGQHLPAKVRRGVDQDVLPGEPDED